MIKIVSADGPESLGKFWTVFPTREEIEATFAEATRLGRLKAAHAMCREAIEDVVRAGADTVEHGWYMTEENCRTLIDHDVYLVPTVSNIWAIVRRGPELGMPWAPMITAEEPEILDRFRMAIELGVKLAMGTDVGGNVSHRYGDNAKELEIYVECGMSPMDAIGTATLEAARAIRRDESVGSIEPGKLADLVVIDGDPLTDISLTRTGVAAVVQGERSIATISGSSTICARELVDNTEAPDGCPARGRPRARGGVQRHDGHQGHLGRRRRAGAERRAARGCCSRSRSSRWGTRCPGTARTGSTAARRRPRSFSSRSTRAIRGRPARTGSTSGASPGPTRWPTSTCSIRAARSGTSRESRPGSRRRRLASPSRPTTFAGFDATTSPPALVVGTTTRRRVRVDLEPADADVTYTVEDPAVATVGITAEGIVVGGESPGTTIIRAASAGELLAELEVSVKDAREEVVNFFFVSDSSEPALATSRDRDKATILTLRLNRVYRRQANVHFTLGQVQDIVVPVALGPVVRGEDVSHFRPFAVSGQLNVFCVWSCEPATCDETDPSLLFLPDDDCPDGMTVPHGAGHFLGFGESHPPAGLMSACNEGADRRRIPKELADIVNP